MIGYVYMTIALIIAIAILISEVDNE